MHTSGESEDTEVVPSPVVSTTAVNRAPKVPFDGRLEMVGVLGVSRSTIWVSELELGG